VKSGISLTEAFHDADAAFTLTQFISGHKSLTKKFDTSAVAPLKTPLAISRAFYVHHLYIMYSSKLHQFYTACTTSLDKRLQEHTNGVLSCQSRDTLSSSYQQQYDPRSTGFYWLMQYHFFHYTSHVLTISNVLKWRKGQLFYADQNPV